MKLLIAIWLFGSIPFNAMATSQPAFWQLTKAGQAPLSILGSIHVGNAKLYPLSPEIDQAFEHASQLIVEVDTSRITRAQMQSVTPLTRLPTPQKLIDTMPLDQYRALKAALTPLGLNRPEVKTFQPWFVLMSALQFKLEQLGYPAAMGVDRHYINKANQNNKPIMQLEDMQKQIWHMAQLAQQTDTYVTDGLKQLAQIDQLAPQLLQAWAEGNLAELELLLAEGQLSKAEIAAFQAMMSERNQDWLAQLLQLPAQEPVFIVVGTLHLIGPSNLIQLLEQAGYRSQRLQQNHTVPAAKLD